MTAANNQRPAHTTTAKSAQTLIHRQQHEHPTPDAPEAATTAQRALPKAQPLATYIRHVVDTAPRPTPEQLTRLAGLLRNTDDDPDVPS